MQQDGVLSGFGPDAVSIQAFSAKFYWNWADLLLKLTGASSQIEFSKPKRASIDREENANKPKLASYVNSENWRRADSSLRNDNNCFRALFQIIVFLMASSYLLHATDAIRSGNDVAIRSNGIHCLAFCPSRTALNRPSSRQIDAT